MAARTAARATRRSRARCAGGVGLRRDGVGSAPVGTGARQAARGVPRCGVVRAQPPRLALQPVPQLRRRPLQLALLRQPPRVTGEAVLASWLRTTAHNLYRNSGRRRCGVPLVDEKVAEAAWVALCRQADADDAIDAVQRCLEELPDRMRSALQLRYSPNGSRRAVGDRLGLADDGAKTLLRRARERLVRCVRFRQEES